MGTLHEDQCTYIVYCIVYIVLRMRSISDNSCSKNQNTHFFCFNHAVHEVMWINNVESGRQQMTLGRTRIEC
jgi:hypothetical protein